ncbi:ABC transporter permease [Jannaschia formosa]|uniref:ABC transporter permease n=1 Tax=Jannaschia formosa TaxID=2259592 RepID=UPI000E1C1A8E|nr:ABC transporter permease [Jannaschia formosa]TFL19165.1 ABC transporter permease [Jannaschia formosa]
MKIETPDPPGPVTVAISLGALLAVWVVAARLTADPTILPGPLAVWQVILEEAASGELGRHVGATLRRVALAFAAAMAFGTALGVALGLSPRFDRWAGPWVTVALNVPALVVIVLCYLWIGLNETAAITAVAVNKTAMVAVILREGIRSLDPGASEMAKVYRMSHIARIRHVVLPQLWPFFSTAIRNGIAIIWKIVLVVEFLGRSDGVGFRIHLFFQLFEIDHVLAYSVTFIAVMLAFEYGVVRLLETRSTRWREARAA